jgi:hypothetical protein
MGHFLLLGRWSGFLGDLRAGFGILREFRADLYPKIDRFSENLLI